MEGEGQEENGRKDMREHGMHGQDDASDKPADRDKSLGSEANDTITNVEETIPFADNTDNQTCKLGMTCMGESSQVSEAARLAEVASILSGTADDRHMIGDATGPEPTKEPKFSERCKCDGPCLQMITEMKRDFTSKLNTIISDLAALRIAAGITLVETDKQVDESTSRNVGVKQNNRPSTPAGASYPPESNFSSAFSNISVPNWASAAAAAIDVDDVTTSGSIGQKNASPVLNPSKLPARTKSLLGQAAVPGRHSSPSFTFTSTGNTSRTNSYNRPISTPGSQKKRKNVTISDSPETEAGEAKKLKTNLYPDVEIRSARESDVGENTGHAGKGLEGIVLMEEKPNDDAIRPTGPGYGLARDSNTENDKIRSSVNERGEDEFDLVVAKNKHGRQVAMRSNKSSNVSAPDIRHPMPTTTSIDGKKKQPVQSKPDSAKKTNTKFTHEKASSAGSNQTGREWAMTKEQHERRRANDLGSRFSYINRRAQTLVIGDSHLHGLRGSEVSPSVHFMVAGGLCYTATARCLSEIRDTFQNFRMIYIALGTNDILHHSNEEIRAGLAFLLEQTKRIFPSAKTEFILPFVSPKLLSLGFQTDEFLKLLRSVVGSAVVHHNIDLSGHLDYFAENPRKPGPAVHLKREHGVGLMVNLIKRVMGIKQPIPIHKTKPFNMPAPTPKKSYWDKSNIDCQTVGYNASATEDFPSLQPSKVNLDSLSVGQLLKALELASHF